MLCASGGMVSRLTRALVVSSAIVAISGRRPRSRVTADSAIEVDSQPLRIVHVPGSGDEGAR